MSSLSVHEKAAVHAVLDPDFVPDAKGRYRGPANYRGGDNSNALSIDVEKGIWFDHVVGEGGDTIDYVRKALNTDFRGACRAIEQIIGRNPIASTPPHRRLSAETLAKAARFRVGILWQLDRYLETLTAELWRRNDAM